MYSLQYRLKKNFQKQAQKIPVESVCDIPADFSIALVRKSLHSIRLLVSCKSLEISVRN